MVQGFRAIDPRQARIILVEGGARVLPQYPESLSAKAEASLRKMGVEVLTKSPVTSVRPDAVVIGGRLVHTTTTLWAAGVQASPLARSLGVPLDRVGRVLVSPDLTLAGHPEVFVIDEPMVGLDPHHGRVVKDTLKERSLAGMTVFLSTHQLSVAEEMADRIGIIHQGRLIAVGTRDELRRQSGATGPLEETFLALTAQEVNGVEEKTAAK